MTEPPQLPEYLESGTGTPVAAPRRSRRPLALAGAAVAGALLLGGVAGGLWWWSAEGGQAAEAFPASALGYVGLTLDPSGSQKVEALTTLRRFPALADELDLGGALDEIDLKESLATAFLDTAPCAGLSYEEHLEPWLGDRLGIAAVPVAGEPQPVLAIQVEDEDAAEDGLNALSACGVADGSADGGFFEVRDGWALLAPQRDVLEVAVADARKATLAEDPDFQRWTEEAGGPGVLTLYVAAGAASYLDEGLGDLVGGFGTTASGGTEQAGGVLDDFGGAAAQLRFEDGAVEIEVAAGVPGSDRFTDGGDVAALVTSLPEDTVLVAGTSVGGELATEWQHEAEAMADDLLGDLFAFSEVELSALLGDAMALTVGPGLDLGGLFSAAAPAGSMPQVPLALVTTGDRAAADDVAAPMTGAGPIGVGLAGLLGVEPVVAGEDGRVVLGVDRAWAESVAAGGSLGGSESFRAALPDAAAAQGLLFLDVAAVLEVLRANLPDLGGDDDQVLANLEPVDALGVTSEADGEVVRVLFRFTTR